MRWSLDFFQRWIEEERGVELEERGECVFVSWESGVGVDLFMGWDELSFRPEIGPASICSGPV